MTAVHQVKAAKKTVKAAGTQAVSLSHSYILAFLHVAYQHMFSSILWHQDCLAFLHMHVNMRSAAYYGTRTEAVNSEDP